MKSRPLHVFCGSVNTIKSANELSDFNYSEISDDISIATYSCISEEQRLFIKPPENSFDNSLIIERFNVKCPSFIKNGENRIVNVAFILKGINFLLGDDESETQEMHGQRFGSESITQIVLPELLASYLFLFEIKNTQEKVKQAYLRGWAYQLAHAITQTLTCLFVLQSPKSFKQSDIQKIKLLGFSLKSSVHKSSPSLQEMAATSDMSITKFKSIFKEVFDVSPHQYILDLKLNHAQYLLKQHSLSISEVAYKVGFNHPSSLTRLFQNKLGIAPNEV